MKDLHFNFKEREFVTNFEIIKEAIETNQMSIASNIASLLLKLETAEIITFGAVAPGADVASIIYVDTVTLRLYVKVSGTWRYTTLT